MRILLVSQFYPGPRDPDYGAFVAQLERELERRGHQFERAVIDHRGAGRLGDARLGARAAAAALRFRPDVIYSHFLVPAGALAAVASLLGRAPLVMTAHGQDVRNVGAAFGVGAITAAAIRRARRVIAVSDYLRQELVARVPAADGRVDVIDCGVDLERFKPRDAVDARSQLGIEGEPPFFLFVGSLEERKNVVALAEAFKRHGRGTLLVVGDGRLRPRLEGIGGVRLAGRLPHAAVPDWIAACDVLCLPSTVEPFGQVLLEAMACERSVVATQVGGPPEIVRPEAGVLVDPGSVDSIADGLARAAALPSPNPAARKVAAEHDLRRQAARIEAVLESAARSRR